MNALILIPVILFLLCMIGFINPTFVDKHVFADILGQRMAMAVLIMVLVLVALVAGLFVWQLMNGALKLSFDEPLPMFSLVIFIIALLGVYEVATGGLSRSMLIPAILGVALSAFLYAVFALGACSSGTSLISCPPIWFVGGIALVGVALMICVGVSLQTSH